MPEASIRSAWLDGWWLDDLSLTLSNSFKRVRDVLPAQSNHNATADGDVPLCYRSLHDTFLADAADPGTGLLCPTTLCGMLGAETRVPVVYPPSESKSAEIAPGGVYGGGRRVETSLHLFFSGMHERQMEGREPALEYLKDWHFVRDCAPAAHNSLDASHFAPPPCRDDALNAWFDARGGTTRSGSPTCTVQDSTAAHEQALPAYERDDYRFLYCGAPGTSTGIHHDVLGSCSWSSNICGWKLWIFAPPEWSRTHLYNKWGDVAVHDLRNAEQVKATDRAIWASLQAWTCGSLDGSAFQEGRLRVAANKQPHEADEAVNGDRCHSLLFCLSGPGDTVYVPPIWHHQVVNLGCAPSSATGSLEPAIGYVLSDRSMLLNAVLSVNHNWAGGAHLPALGAFLFREWSAVTASIADCAPEQLALDPFCGAAVGSGKGTASQWAEWYDTCDRVLAANAALGLAQWGSLLLYRARSVCGAVSGSGIHSLDEGKRISCPGLPITLPALSKSVAGLMAALAGLAGHPFARTRAECEPASLSAAHTSQFCGPGCSLRPDEHPHTWRRADLHAAALRLGKHLTACCSPCDEL